MSRSVLAIALSAAFVTAACATSLPSTAAEDPHHLQAGAPQTAATAQPAAPQRQMGMMMMGAGGQQGTAGGTGMMDMMRMMQTMQMMHGMMHGGPADHIEGRIAFLRAELKVSDAQAGPWNGFAEAVRANARVLNEAQNATAPAGQAPSFAQRLQTEEQRLTARLDGLRSIRAAVVPLEASLSEEQKKTAQELLPSIIGLSAMPMANMARAVP